MMHSEFRFTRHGLSSPYDVTVSLEAIRADAFSVGLASGLNADSTAHQAVLKGVSAAYASAPNIPLAVTVAGITDHSGNTGDLGYKICGEAAMYHLLGLPERALFPGYVLGEA